MSAHQDDSQFGVSAPDSITRRGADVDGSPSLRVAEDPGITFPPQTLPPLLLTADQKKWRHNEYFIRMGGVPVMVDVEYDAEYVGDPLEARGTVAIVVRGECPDCAINECADSAEFSHEFTTPEVETITCDCGNAWTLESGVPKEFRP